LNLLVVRHAVAMDRADYQEISRAESTPLAEINDDLRPLTEDGARRMRKGAKGLRQLCKNPELLVTSPLERARQTLEILREVWPDAAVATCEELRPGAEPARFCEWLRERFPYADKSDAVVIIGHEPHLSTLVAWFMDGSRGSRIELKKGGACLLEFPAESEDGGIGRRNGRLLWLATPKILRQMR
jgi:phosphohistidine phosphatase